MQLQGEPLNRVGAMEAARPSRNRMQTSSNAETQRARSNAEEKSIFFLLSLRSSANLCVSALNLRRLRANPDIAVQWCRDATELREAFGVGGACSRFRTTPADEQRQQAGRTPNASHGVSKGSRGFYTRQA